MSNDFRAGAEVATSSRRKVQPPLSQRTNGGRGRTDGVQEPASPAPTLSGARLPMWAAALGLALLACPTLYLIGLASWTDEQSQQGPIVLAIGGWLLWRRWPQMRQEHDKGSPAICIVSFLGCAGAYVLGRVASLFLFEAYALYGFIVTSIYYLVGWRGVLKGAFPMVFLLFAAPIPFFVNFPVTVHLRVWITEAAVDLLRAFGVSTARDGLTLFVESYRIEIAQACSGMNSLAALTALGLCYVHIRRDPTLLFYVAIFPIIVVFAIVANFARVMLVAALTLGFGDAVAQGFLHETLGFVTFGIALILTLFADSALARVWPPRQDRPGSFA